MKDEMPKASQIHSERSKIRFLFVEGDFAAGDLQQLTQALSNAIRPAPVQVRGALQSRSESATANIGNENGSDGHAKLFEELAGEEVDAPATTENKSPRVRKYRSPQAVDIDLTSGAKSGEAFAVEKNPDSHRAKYLVAAAWLHEHRGVKTIKADHVFTCYKGADWTFDIQDPTQTFRQLKAEQLGTLSREGFSINHLGIADVKKMQAMT